MLNTLLIGLSIAFANSLQVITGFGSVIIALPFVSAILGIKDAIIVVTLIAYTLSIYILITNYKYINLKQSLTMIGFMLPTLFIGIYIFRNIDSNLFKTLVAIFIIIVSLFNIYKTFKSKKENQNQSLISKLFSYFSLIIGGIVQGAISSGGPLVVLYATKNIHDKKEFRASLSLLWVTLNTVLISSYFYYGLETKIIFTSLYQIPFLIAGIIIGEKIHNKLDSKTFSIFVYVLLIIISILFIVL